MSVSEKVKMTIEMKPQIRQRLKKLSEDVNLSENAIIERALEKVFEEFDADLLEYLVKTSTKMIAHEKVIKEYGL